MHPLPPHRQSLPHYQCPPAEWAFITVQELVCHVTIIQHPQLTLGLTLGIMHATCSGEVTRVQCYSTIEFH